MRPASVRSRSAFTLIELLVVIAIIAILMSLSMAAFSGVFGKAYKSETKSLVERLKLAIENYQNDFGDYPPSDPKRAGLPANGRNDGIECLLQCLTTTKKSGPYFEFPEERLVNTDGDARKTNVTTSMMLSPQLFEMTDAWGRPLVYLHNADYAKGHLVVVPQEEGDPKDVAVKGVTGGKSGSYHGFTSFQLMSLGADGAPGGDDDVTSWD